MYCSCLSIMSMFSFQAIHNARARATATEPLFIDYVNVLFSSNSQHADRHGRGIGCCLSIMSMFSFQAIHNRRLKILFFIQVVYRLCQCSLFKQFTTVSIKTHTFMSCLSIMSMFSFQAIHNKGEWCLQPLNVVYRLCQCSLFKQFTTNDVWEAQQEALFIDYVNVLFSSNSQLSVVRIRIFLVVYRLCQYSLFKQFTTLVILRR